MHILDSYGTLTEEVRDSEGLKTCKKFVDNIKICLYAYNIVAVNGGWSLWGSWSFCHAKTGKKKRRRQCNNPAPCNGGAPCSGSSSEVTICTTGNICINC